MTKQKYLDVYKQTVVIGPSKWKIEPVDEEDVSTLYGSCSVPYYAKIKLNTNNTGMRALDTFLHETIHAIDFMAGINLKEHQVEVLGHMLAFLLRDNPWIFDYVVQQVDQEYNSHNK